MKQFSSFHQCFTVSIFRLWTTASDEIVVPRFFVLRGNREALRKFTKRNRDRHFQVEPLLAKASPPCDPVVEPSWKNFARANDRCELPRKSSEFLLFFD